MSRTLAEVWGYATDARANWYDQHRARRVARFSQTAPTTREIHYERHCPLCGIGLGGVERVVIPIPRNPYAPRGNSHEVFCERPRPPRLVACASCLRLHRGELCARYCERNARRHAASP